MYIIQYFRGKCIIFVNTVDRCYKLKLFLEQFGIPTCVLNSELPASSRCRAVTQFNTGIYDIIIASDEKALEEVNLFNKIIFIILFNYYIIIIVQILLFKILTIIKKYIIYFSLIQ
jgi:hypothetical protein